MACLIQHLLQQLLYQGLRLLRTDAIRSRSNERQIGVP